MVNIACSDKRGVGGTPPVAFGLRPGYGESRLGSLSLIAKNVASMYPWGRPFSYFLVNHELTQGISSGKRGVDGVA
jgi:hypothetical protein